jgi:replicative DNA helicase
MGKTEFCFHMAKNNAMIGNKVAYLSMEMKAADLVKRSARQYAHINKLERSDKNLTEEQKEDFTKHYKYFVNINNLQIVSFDDETTIDVVEKYILELHTQ